jgi:flagellar basal body-associated protein FliL
MESILLGLALLACPVGMGLMMWFMAKGMGGRDKKEKSEVESMRAEQQRLASEVERLERERSGEFAAR